MKLNNFLKYCGWATIAAAAIVVFIHIWVTPLLADDMYYGVLSPRKGGLRDAMAGVWWHTNARFGDMTNYVWLCMLPRVITALLCAGMMILLFVSLAGLVEATPGRRPAFWCFVIASASLLLPWWDCFSLIVVHLNYVWAIALAGLSMWLIISKEMHSRRYLLYAPVAFISGFGHEIVGIPMLLGVLAWLLWCRHGKISRTKKIVIAALLLGCLISVSSPGCYHRLQHPLPSADNDWSTLELLIISGFFGLIVMVDALFMLLFKREKLRQLVHTRWLPFSIISVSSIIFIVASHTIGRTGWATQFFGLAALLYRLSESGISLGKWRWVASMPPLLMAAQWIGAGYWQLKIDREVSDNLEEFFANPEQELTCHITCRDEVPLWVMRKAEPDWLIYPWPREVIGICYGVVPKLPEEVLAKAD